MPKWFLEVLGVWGSRLNECDYCVEHHFSGLVRLLKDDGKASALRAAIEARDMPAVPLEEKHRVAMVYARLLSKDPGGMVENSVQAPRSAGWSDGEILEINQVSA